jgi:hypothetical protein
MPNFSKGRPLEQGRTGLCAQFVQQRLGILQIGGVEAFGEPVIDNREYRARFIATTGVPKQPRETHRRTYFQRFAALRSQSAIQSTAALPLCLQVLPEQSGDCRISAKSGLNPEFQPGGEL